MKTLITSLVATCVLGLCSTLSAQEEAVSPEQFVKDEGENGATFEVKEGEVTPVDLLELVYQCTQPAPEAAGDFLVVRGFNIVDARDYRLRGPRALSTALARAELDAKAAAAEALNAVAVVASSTNTLSDTTTDASAEASNGDELEVLQSFSTQSVETLTQVSSSNVAAFLTGGRTTGTKIISLGDQGMCIVVRYEIPIDQTNADPAQDLQQEGETASPAEEETDEGHGFEAPPAGSIGDF